MENSKKPKSVKKLSKEDTQNVSGGLVVKVYPYVEDMEDHLWKKDVEFVIVNDQTGEVLGYDNDMNVTNRCVNKPLLLDDGPNRYLAERAPEGKFEDIFCFKDGEYYYKPLLEKKAK